MTAGERFGEGVPEDKPVAPESSLPMQGIMGFAKWIQTERFVWHGNHGRWLRGDNWPPKGADFLTDQELFEQWFGKR